MDRVPLRHGVQVTLQARAARVIRELDPGSVVAMSTERPGGDDEPGQDGARDDRSDAPLLDGFDVDKLEIARRRHGGVGSVLAAAMLGLDEALGRKPKEEIPVVVASNSDPEDIDHEGIVIPIDEATSVVAPPQPRGREAGARGRIRGKRRRLTR